MQEPRKARRRWLILVLALMLLPVLFCFGFLWSAASSGFLGTEKDEEDFSAEQQQKLLETFFPVPVPPSATDLRIRYEAFQDWHLDISFTLPPEDFEAFVAQLTPAQGQPGAYAGRTQLGDGGFVANDSSITVEPATRRVKLTAFTR